MGAIFAVWGLGEPASGAAALARIAEVSPHRGDSTTWHGHGLALGLQSLGWDASMVEQDGRVFVVHGYLCVPGAVGDEARAGGTSSVELSAADILAQIWAEYGPTGVGELDGEFALLVVDHDCRTLTAACSIAGSRPLFWGQSGGRVGVATEVRQVRAALDLVPRLDETQLVRMVLQRPIAEEATLDQRVKRVYPGSIYRFDLDRSEGATERKTFWSPPQPAGGKGAWSEAESAARLRQLLDDVVTDSVPRRPWALSLSGGRDSSAIWALADRSYGRPVCLEFPGLACDERSLVEQTLKHRGAQVADQVSGPEPLWIDAAAADPLARTDALITGLDTPPFATTYFAMLAAEAAEADGRRILFMGNGGDEWLGGAPRPYLEQEFFDGRWLAGLAGLLRFELPDRHRRRDLLWGWGLRPAVGRVARGLGYRRQVRDPSWITAEGQRVVAEARWPDWVENQAGPVRQLLARTLHRRRTSHELWALEQTTAACGVEIRLPFMHRRLIDLAFTVPPHRVIGGRREKHLMRLALEHLYAPGVAARRSRTTFDEIFERRIEELRRSFLAHEWPLTGLPFIDKTGLERFILGCTEGPELRESMSLYLADRFVATL